MKTQPRRGPARPHAAAPEIRFFTHHGMVLATVAAERFITMAAVAERTGMSLYGVAHVLGQLRKAGYLQVAKVGRRNRYNVVRHRTLQYPGMPKATSVGQLLRVGNAQGSRHLRGGREP